jgi:O-antigen ligase
MIAALWAEQPMYAIQKPLQLAALILVTLCSIVVLRDFSDGLRSRIIVGLVHGALVGLLYLLIEHISDGALKRIATNTTGLLPAENSFNTVQNDRVIDIDLQFLNRNSAALAIVIWPILALVSASHWSTVYRRAAAGLLLVLAFVASFYSFSESAKLALVLASVVFLLACLSRRWAFLSVAAGWICLTLLIIPLVFLVFPRDTPYLETLKEMHRNAAYRVGIWQYQAERVLERPLLGIGTDMTIVESRAKLARGVPRGYDTARHAHNVFLQVWFELGGIGAALFCALGLTVLAAIRKACESLQPFMLAHFASVTAIAFGAYGLWQMWLLAIVLTSACLLAARLPQKT